MKQIPDAGDVREPKGEHYFSRKQSSPNKPRQLRMFINGREIRLRTSSGMFSPGKVDNATLLLIETMSLGKAILDLGCGYGPIGIAAAVANPSAEVTMAEINERAARLAMGNLAENRISNALVVESDFFEKLAGEKYDTILMNPPMALGMEKLFALIAECKEHLSRKGTLQIVARHGKGGKRLEERMNEVFGNVGEVAKGGGFRVYMSTLSK